MKLFIVLSLIACGYAAKLDRTYLPPSSAATAGGSPGSINAPSGPFGSPGFGQPSANSGFGQPAGFGPSNVNTFGKSTSGPAFGAQTSGSSGSAPATGSAPSTLYGQPGSSAGSLDAGFSQAANGFEQGAQSNQRNQPQRAQASADQNAEILRLDNQNDGETFSYSFETSNGIAAEESGVATNGVQAQGAFSYSDDDGQSFRVTYTADENGYQPQGDHLPTPHPIPEEILKSIEQNAQAAAAGTQEGAYDPNEDSSDSFQQQQYSNNAPNSYGQGPSGSGSFNQPQGSGPSQLYGAPNAGGIAGSRPESGGQGFPSQGSSQQFGISNGGSRLQSGSQGFQTQGSTQQFGSSNGGGFADKSSNGFGQPQAQSPSKLYGSPSGTAVSGANGASQVRPNSFTQNQPQGLSQQYGASSRPSSPGSSDDFLPLGPASNGFAPSGLVSQSQPSQYQAPSQSGFSSAGRPQGSAQGVQAQDNSGYQYDRPQGSSFGQANGRPSSQGSSGQPRPQNVGAQSSGSQSSFLNPSSNNAGYSSSPAQGSFGSLSGPSSQGSFGPSTGPNAGSPSVSNAQSSFGQSGISAGQGSFSPSSSSAGQGYFGPSAGSKGSSSFGPSVGSNNQSSFRPSGANGLGRPQNLGVGSNGVMPDSGYSYDRPGSQPGAGSQQPFGPNAPGSGSGQSFGGPRQPPSFSEEEGYKY